MFTRIHHVGLVVADLEPARRLWLDTYGFQVDESRSPLPEGRYVPLDDVNILDIPVGESELEINKANDPHSGTGRYLERRGSGPHHICLYSNDIEADVSRLQENGLRLIASPQVSRDQKGNSKVAFFHPRGNLGFLLELWQDMPTKGDVPFQSPHGRGGTITRLHHVGLVHSSLEEAYHLFSDIYGLKLDEERTPLPHGRYAPNDNVRVLEFQFSQSMIEVTVPQDQASGTARFLAARGSGIHHICFYSQDIQADVSRLKGAGLKQIGELGPPRPDGSLVAFFHPKTNMGTLVELWQDLPLA